jgi:hypothetical protein
MLPSLQNLCTSANLPSSEIKLTGHQGEDIGHLLRQLDISAPKKSQVLPALTHLVVVIDGLPGAGKNYICKQLEMKVQDVFDKQDPSNKFCKIVEADLDTFSQPRLKENDTFLKTIKRIQGDIYTFIAKSTQVRPNDPGTYQNVVVLLYGVSYLPSRNGKRVSMLPNTIQPVLRLWLDIVPRDYLGQVIKGLDKMSIFFDSLKQQYSITDNEAFFELVESARRATLREFGNIDDWVADPNEHDFNTMPIPSVPITNIEFAHKFKIPLIDFVNDAFYGPYLQIMLTNMIQEDFQSNRSTAMSTSFTPININDTNDPVNTVYAMLCKKLGENSCLDAAKDCN